MMGEGGYQSCPVSVVQLTLTRGPMHDRMIRRTLSVASF